MSRARDTRGFSTIELLVAATIALAVIAAAAVAYSQARTIALGVDARTNVQSHLRLSMEQLKRDLRTVGFGVPDGPQAGGSTSWAPALFHAAPTAIGFRADVDGGNTTITCTPKTTNATCPTDALHVERAVYHDALGCESPDGSGSPLALVAVIDDDIWHPLTCSAVTASRLSTTTVPSDFFEAGRSSLYSIEHVYLRYVTGGAPEFGRLERAVVYRNTPDATFPPIGLSWEVVAEHLTDVLFEFRDEAGAVLSSTPLSASDRAAVRSVTIVLEGFDRRGQDGRAHQIPLRSHVALRNVR